MLVVVFSLELEKKEVVSITVDRKIIQKKKGVEK